MELNVGVVGVGVMGTYHAQVYAGLPGVRLVGVADPDPFRQAAIEQDLEVPAYPNPEDLLGKVQAVSIASPTSFHYEQARMFLEAGVHVLLEKPMTRTLREAQELARIAERRGVVLQVGHIVRFYRAVGDLMQMVRSPWVLEARRMSNNRRIRDIGVVLDLMIHDLDLVLLLLREKPLRYSVVGRRVDGLDEFAQAVVDFPSGARALFTASRISPQAERSLTITQPGEVLRLDFNSEYTELSVHRSPPVHPDPDQGVPNGRTQVQTERIAIHNENPLRRQLKHFVDRIQKGEPPLVTLEDDLQALELALELSSALQPVGV
ncbi:MAG: Gfo/Idh/MocA family oxidoreductase [Meiothermus sp.]|uniref:Gfo/Idh/MocA family protein n=1 Tax=Meiothermus sp. TaxID=1955249 RepID=UPI0025DAF54E|nr:Gfo/Idh/MocA family oxidoreductase [Meiothermus sp.]MCS7057888.1 Gfo/Idh/MocA family oxidoreductase [Meiothermus sp.]MCS7194236.1 Gfo/Idh/MocA family oxidoreductase [Meiothermus sp.]MCX7740474.1 Gfo/Idh/MocA family oxidoreductase [Meiothermus sp.]MDW8090097.1 Gfo/Idh/MocA family oxidoreductase [Meiothermus sp.]MDW8480747.1 Gfo/Idh/MocA family oxidoreductase [Meiothermus sp.]